MKLSAIINRFLLLAFVLAGSVPARAEGTNTVPAPKTARDFYNAGTRLLDNGKFTEAEVMFESALAAQDEHLQPAALYNLGHTRFDQGAELLKKGPDAQKVLDQGKAALAEGDQAIQNGNSALAQNDMGRLVNAYLEGRGARHDLRAAEKAVHDALETYGGTLHKWERSVDDFKGAAELNPADTNATHNAQVVERAIAKLVDQIRMMQEMAGALAGKRSDVGKMMSKLKGAMPGFQAPPGPSGEDGDEDDITPGELAGQKENPSREGNELQVQMSPDQAAQMLNNLQIDGARRLPMNSNREGKPDARNTGRIW